MKRRTFIAGCGTVVIGSALAGADSARFRIGQIGTTGAHASGKMMAMRSLKDRWEVAGIVEPEAHLLQRPETARAWQGLRVLTEEELLGLPDVQAVAVETRIGDATSTALRALRAGKHVHLEKPGGSSHADYKAMRLEAERRNLIVQMGYMLRYNPAFELLYRAAREKWLGDITEIDVFIGKLGDPQARNFIHQLPGGGMFELGCHVIEIVPMESRNVTLSLDRDHGSYRNGTQKFQFGQPSGRYDGEFIDLFRVLRGEKRFMWDAAHDIAVHEAVLRASGVWEGGGR